MSAVEPSVCLVTMMSAKGTALASPMSLSRASSETEVPFPIATRNNVSPGASRYVSLADPALVDELAAAREELRAVLRIDRDDQLSGAAVVGPLHTARGELVRLDGCIAHARVFARRRAVVEQQARAR